MRWLFGILLLANLSLFLWKSGDEIKVARQSVPAATVPGVPGLKLLEEISETDAGVAASPSPEPESTTQPETAEEATRPAPASDPTPAPESETAPEPEPEPATATVEEAMPTEAAAPAAAPPEEPFCARLGPFAERETARSAITDLAASQVYATLTAEGEERPPRHIVYLPPAASRKEALETLRELQSKKIDSFVFSSGELRNGISLGIFSQLASAQRLLKKMKARGYDVRMVTRERETQRFWAVLGPKNSVRLTPELQAALQERYPEAAYQREACP